MLERGEKEKESEEVKEKEEEKQPSKLFALQCGLRGEKKRGVGGIEKRRLHLCVLI